MLPFTSVIASKYQADPVAWARQERAWLERISCGSKPFRHGKAARITQRFCPTTITSNETPRLASDAVLNQAARYTGDATDENRSQAKFEHCSQRLFVDAMIDRRPQFCQAVSSVALRWSKPKDLRCDPNVSHVSSAEGDLASKLGISIEKYLEVRDRMFIACIRTWHAGGTFNRSRAQKGAKIDVNKASALHQVLQRSGVFDHVRKNLPVRSCMDCGALG